jgi:hypothetical protein
MLIPERTRRWPEYNALKPGTICRYVPTAEKNFTQ